MGPGTASSARRGALVALTCIGILAASGGISEARKAGANVAPTSFPPTDGAFFDHTGFIALFARAVKKIIHFGPVRPGLVPSVRGRSLGVDGDAQGRVADDGRLGTPGQTGAVLRRPSDGRGGDDRLGTPNHNGGGRRAETHGFGSSLGGNSTPGHGHRGGRH